ncbi:hypothetical protein DICVIV_05188 [Dictyocaulus viviparus]|uniref:Uncharacterized protein n=1 Tax=Dictyocaulus viviparus TaxID=29172 RepID=A0A0D8XY06_DICVI|nr:hypothetical protein DICVIV_05188 [Dictyocaulus viviparus]
MDWDSPKCRLNVPPPLFAPNYDVSRALANKQARIRAKSAVRATESQPFSSFLRDSSIFETTDNHVDGFFTPVLPSVASTPRRAVHSKGESTSTRPITTTDLITLAPSTALTSVTSTTAISTLISTTVSTTTTGTATSAISKSFTTATQALSNMESSISTPNVPSHISYISEYNRTDFDEILTTVTNPLEHTTRTVPRATTMSIGSYERNDETTRPSHYLGDSIWASVDVLPDPMVANTAWRKFLPKNTTRLATTARMPKITTATAQEAKIQWQPTTRPQQTTRTVKKSTIAGWCN